jgi:hypothetical protein
LLCTGGVDDQPDAAIEDLTLGHPLVDVRFVALPEQGGQPAHATPGSQRRQQSRRGRSASRRQHGAGERRDSGRERGRKRANLLPVVAQADLDAGQLLDVAAAKKLMRARSIPAAPGPLTAASNSASLCSAPMTSRNSLTIGIP